jgi:hypothetical protein
VGDHDPALVARVVADPRIDGGFVLFSLTAPSSSTHTACPSQARAAATRLETPICTVGWMTGAYDGEWFDGSPAIAARMPSRS